MRRVYVDFDDVLSETARGFLEILEETFGRTVEFDAITQFDLRKSFDLTDRELESFLDEAHRPERLREFRPIAGAIEGLREWHADGASIDVLTGRPPTSGVATREWLERHGVPHRDLFFVDKYAHYDAAAWDGHERVLLLAELHGDSYDLIVEDNLETAVYMAENTTAQVYLLDKPWNRSNQHGEASFDGIERCSNWRDLSARIAGASR